MPYVKTVRGVPGMTVIEVEADGTVLSGRRSDAGRAKTHALDGRPLAAHRAGRSFRPVISICTPIMPTATTAAMRRSASCLRERILGRAIAMPDIPWIGLEGPLVGPEDLGEAGAATVLPHPAAGAPR